MKVNVLCIVKDHYSTFRDARTNKPSLWDFAIFLGVPIFIAVAGNRLGFTASDQIETSLIAVFSVFAALLFSAQIALFGMHTKDIPVSKDEIEEARNEIKRKARKDFFREVNSNVSYLILFSVISLVWLLCSLLVKRYESLEDAITLAVTMHFVLTLLMLIKRVHIAFAATYQQE